MQSADPGAIASANENLLKRNARIHRVTSLLPRPLRRLIRTFWHAWLHLLASRAWVRDFAIPILVTIITRLILGFFVGSDTNALGSSALTESAFDISVLLLTMAFVRWSITWGVPEMMENVRDIAAATQEPKREFLRDLATEEVGKTRDIVRGLTGGGYIVRHASELRPWFKRFFDWGGGDYVGVDSHGPSGYLAEFSWFLDVHADSLEDRGHPGNDRRVLTTPRAEVASELRQRNSEYQNFYRWHPDHRVDIYWSDSADLSKLRRDLGIGGADIALWEKFAVLFESEGNGCLKLQMWFPDESERDNTTYEKISAFVDSVLAKAEPLENVDPSLDLVDRELADEWESYVAPEERAAGGLDRFLTGALNGKRFVLDAAAGIGCDSVRLIKAGLSVTSNEVDELFRSQAEQYAAARGVKLSMTKLLWENLPEQIPGHMRFEAITCLGNSICLVDDPHNRIRCLKAFHASLVSDGVLIIDEHNFQLMLDRAREIEGDPIKNFPATTAGDVMYRGVRVRGYPAIIDPSARTVQWRFFRNSPPIEDPAELDSRRLGNSDLLLHAFGHGDLFRALVEAGFSDIDVYADLQLIGEHSQSMPSVEAVGRADFITYVARLC